MVGSVFAAYVAFLFFPFAMFGCSSVCCCNGGCDGQGSRGVSCRQAKVRLGAAGCRSSGQLGSKSALYLPPEVIRMNSRRLHKM
eukprot:1161210-Pelagomonas_calceolata.AAC.9